MFNLLDFIVIKEKDNNSQYKKVYADLKTIYQKKDNDIYGIKIKLEFLPMNFEKYYSFNNGHNSKGNNMDIFLSNIRLKIFTEVRNFLKDKEKIYAICGPFGIGKSFTALAIQKDLYFDNIASIYINLSNQEEIIELKKTLIRESFFINLIESKFIELANKITECEASNIWEIIFEIDDYCFNQKIKYLLILDQYKRARDEKECLFQLKTNKIFLLSSINDKDVKENLVMQIKGNNSLKFKYTYYISLDIDNFIKEISKSVKDGLVLNCLEDFSYLPNSDFLLDNKNDMNILNFLILNI